MSLNLLQKFIHKSFMSVSVLKLRNVVPRVLTLIQSLGYLCSHYYEEEEQKQKQEINKQTKNKNKTLSNKQFMTFLPCLTWRGALRDETKTAAWELGCEWATKKITTILKSFDNFYLRLPLAVQFCKWTLDQKGSGSGSDRDSLSLSRSWWCSYDLRASSRVPS